MASDLRSPIVHRHHLCNGTKYMKDIYKKNLVVPIASSAQGCNTTIEICVSLFSHKSNTVAILSTLTSALSGSPGPVQAWYCSPAG